VPSETSPLDESIAMVASNSKLASRALEGGGFVEGEGEERTSSDTRMPRRVAEIDGKPEPGVWRERQGARPRPRMIAVSTRRATEISRPDAVGRPPGRRRAGRPRPGAITHFPPGPSSRWRRSGTRPRSSVAASLSGGSGVECPGSPPPGRGRIVVPTYTLTINGKPRRVEADAETPLLWVLRDVLQMNGTKFGCGQGVCGACTVHENRQAVRACTVPIAEAAGRSFTTIEGLANGKLHAVQQAWLDEDVAQCGFCQP